MFSIQFSLLVGFHRVTELHLHLRPLPQCIASACPLWAITTCLSPWGPTPLATCWFVQDLYPGILLSKGTHSLQLDRCC